jgi:hypothetical protein
MVDSASQSCSKIKVIYTREFGGAFENATFRNLIDLEIGQLNGGNEDVWKLFYQDIEI